MKWYGYDEYTWEPLSNLKVCDIFLVGDYLILIRHTIFESEFSGIS